MTFAIKVNGKTHSVDVDGDTPLLWVLRDVLGMTGKKLSAVWRSAGPAPCTSMASQPVPASPRSTASAPPTITTIEAIGATAAGAKIQKAWLDREVVQCGYCQSGQIMSATALLASKPPIRQMPISMTRCPATSAAAVRMFAFAKRSKQAASS